jgi:protein arginine N-methyltransferase 1
MDADDELDLLRFHRFLLTRTRARLQRFRQAIAQTVKPGSTVLDLGTGSGILAFLACRAGARRVYAVDVEAAVELARLLVGENGVGDRVVVLAGPSRRVELPERVDVVVSDTFDTFGLQGGGLRSFIDARERLLKPGGTLVPGSLELFLAPVELPGVYRREIDSWLRRRQGLDTSVVRHLAVNNRHPVRVTPRVFLAAPAPVARIDLQQVDSLMLQGEVRLTAQRAGILHGLCGWFLATLADDIELGNRPGASTTNYAQAFFPLARPVPIEAGHRLKASITSHDSIHWRWQVEVEERTPAGRATVRFDHSTFFGTPISAQLRRRTAQDQTPKLTRRGEAEHFLLGLADGATPIAELRRRLLKRYPDVVRSEEDASAFVTDVLSRCA